VAGKLQALDGTTLAVLYDSDTIGGDALGNDAKFVPPTVANGQVFVPTFSNTLVVYGFPPPVTLVTSGQSSASGKTTIQ
jgi:hypothetical protein